MNYKHATEIIEALKTDPSSVDFWAVDEWRPITCVMNNFQHVCLGTLGNPKMVRIRPTPREPRRVWMNFAGGEIAAYHNPYYAKNMAGSLCSEVAVEFVEVVK